MKLLLDTHIFLWWCENSRKLSARTRKKIENADQVSVSVVTAWEMAIKSALGKLRAPADIEAAISDAGFDPLLLGFHHVAASRSLPAHHNDPFDRMLIAQAVAEGMTLLTSDARLKDYGGPVQVVE